MSDRPAWGDDRGPAGDDQPPDDAWAAPAPGDEAGTPPPPAGDAAATTGDHAPLPPPPGEPPADPNVVAIERAGLNQDATEWMRQVAGQVDPRLDRVAPDWRRSAQAGAAQACAFGLLLGYLARTYPHARGDLGRVAEAHPSYSTLQTGNRLGTLEQISADPQRMAAWLGPLVDVSDPQRMLALLD